MISGSHSHHGPVIELTDREGFGKGKFDAAVAYTNKLPELIIEAILEAEKTRRPARMGIVTNRRNLNRNRHTKREPKPTDPMLAVMRFDDAAGKPIAVLVNFAAHPVMTDNKILKFSADYPGFMKRQSKSELEDQLRLHARGRRRHERQRGRVRGAAEFRRAPGRPGGRAGAGGQDRGAEAPVDQGQGRPLPVSSSRTDFANPMDRRPTTQRAFFPELAPTSSARISATACRPN